MVPLAGETPSQFVPSVVDAFAVKVVCPLPSVVNVTVTGELPSTTPCGETTGAP